MRLREWGIFFRDGVFGDWKLAMCGFPRSSFKFLLCSDTLQYSILVSGDDVVAAFAHVRMYLYVHIVTHWAGAMRT